jgi:hypothetical protein
MNIIGRYLAWRIRRRVAKLRRDLAIKETKLRYLKEWTNVGAKPGTRRISLRQLEDEVILAGEIEATKRDLQDAYGKLERANQ